MKKALLVSVGGSPAPLIHTINTRKPEYLFLFVSRSSAASARDFVLPNLEHKAFIPSFIMTPDEQDLERSVAVLLTELPKQMQMWGLAYNDLAADYTGGTKTMSAAVVFALARHIDDFSYVGGTERDKAGLGVVIDGREQMLYMKNPWNELAVQFLKDIELLFNSCRYTSAEETAKTAGEKSSARKQLFDAIQFAASAFNLWDSFQYDKAMNVLKRCESALRQLSAESGNNGLRRFCDDISAALPVLERICLEQNALVKSSAAKDKTGQSLEGTALVYDLLSNAVRRGEIEHKYDDAVARLYSVIEKMAKLRLKAAYGIDNSNVKPEQIPESLKEELIRECSGRDGCIQLPLHKSYLLLAAMNDQLGISYTASETELAKMLSIRNTSLLAHGFEPVKRDTYDKMLTIALGFVGISMEKLPAFPRMSWENSL